MEIFDKYPELANQFELLKRTRRDEILSDMTKKDKLYRKLCHERTDASMALKDAIDSIGEGGVFEKYSDALYAQEIYELDAVYSQAFLDAIYALKEQGVLGEAL